MKTVIKRFFLLFAYVFKHNHKSKILYYHDIGTDYTPMGTPLDLFRSHLATIRRSGFEIVEKISKPTDQVMICFDDGWLGLYEHRQLIAEEKFFPTVFLAVDLVGKKGYLSIDQIKELENMGVKFEGHTWSHRNLTKFDEDGLIHELSDSKVELSRLLGHGINDICFPQGFFSQKVVDAAKKSGYRYLYSSIDGNFYNKFHDEILCRNLLQDSSCAEVRWILMGTSNILRHKCIRYHYSD